MAQKSGLPACGMLVEKATGEVRMTWRYGPNDNMIAIPLEFEDDEGNSLQVESPYTLIDLDDLDLSEEDYEAIAHNHISIKPSKDEQGKWQFERRQDDGSVGGAHRFDEIVKRKRGQKRQGSKRK